MPQHPTELQQQASRQNGAQSNGPITEKGKARSSQNGMKHGLRSRTVVLANESQDLYDELLAAYHAEWNPQGQTENDLVIEISNARWRLRRIWAMETAAIDSEMFIHRKGFDAAFSVTTPAMRQADAFQSLAIGDNNFLDKLDRYENRYTRAFTRAAKNLVYFQKLRGFEANQAELTGLTHDPAVSNAGKASSGTSEPGANPISLLQQLILLITVLIETLTQSWSGASRTPKHPRNHTNQATTAAETSQAPEKFTWESEYTSQLGSP